MKAEAKNVGQGPLSDAANYTLLDNQNPSKQPHVADRLRR